MSLSLLQVRNASQPIPPEYRTSDKTGALAAWDPDEISCGGGTVYTR